MSVPNKPETKTVKRQPYKKDFTTSTGYTIKVNYCRKCAQDLNPRLFFIATDTYLDVNGLMSICINCCEKIFQDCLASEQDLRKAFVKYCRTVNWRYDDRIVEGVIKMIENKGATNYSGAYRTVMQAMSNLSDKFSITSKMTFSEPTKEEFVPQEVSQVDDETVRFWGDGLPLEDYIYLEEEFLQLKKSYKCDLRGEELIFREIAFTLLEIKKARARNDSVEGLQKRLSALMKDSAISPNMVSSANAGKAMDTWGLFVKTIEQNEPCEWIDDEENKKYLDLGDFNYFRNYYLRSLKNFVTGSRDFNIDSVESEEDDLSEAEELEDGAQSETLDKK